MDDNAFNHHNDHWNAKIIHYAIKEHLEYLFYDAFFKSVLK